jgi:crossover junction endodeoxyribonuclease RuvC
LSHIAHGIISTPAHEDFAIRLNTIFEEATRLLDLFKPDCSAIEKLFFSQNVTTGISVAQARGVLAVSLVRAGVPIAEYSPLEVKNAVVGYGKATKKQVQQMVKMLLAMPEIPKPDDAADALAIAICRAYMRLR